MNGLAEEFEGRATVVQLDANVLANERLQLTYGVRGHPSAVILDSEGQVTQRYFGVETAVALRSALNDVLR
ncbi:MAG: hypothetical protein KDE48_07975 [Anaerolineales bacterium]|nr:hypothetical protein [Anaerolineales bacterium]